MSVYNKKYIYKNVYLKPLLHIAKRDSNSPSPFQPVISLLTSITFTENKRRSTERRFVVSNLLRSADSVKQENDFTTDKHKENTITAVDVHRYYSRQTG